MLLLSTMRLGLHHGVSVDHLSDQLHSVVKQLCSSDLSPGSGFGLLELSQQITGSQSSFRQRLLPPENTRNFSSHASLRCKDNSCFICLRHTANWQNKSLNLSPAWIFPVNFLPLRCASVSSISQLNGSLKSLLHKYRAQIHSSWDNRRRKTEVELVGLLGTCSFRVTKEKPYLRSCQILCSVKRAQGRRAGQEPVHTERGTPERNSISQEIWHFVVLDH